MGKRVGEYFCFISSGTGCIADAPLFSKKRVYFFSFFGDQPAKFFHFRNSPEAVTRHARALYIHIYIYVYKEYKYL